MRPRPVVGEATVPDAVRRLLDKFDYPDRESPAQVIPILPTLGGGGGAPTIVVAASDASELSKSKADLVCTGVNDEITIQTAVERLTAVAGGGAGGRILLTEGTFNIGANDVIVVASNQWVTIQGMGGLATRVQSSDSTGIIITGRPYTTIKDIYLVGTGASGPTGIAGQSASTTGIIIEGVSFQGLGIGVDITGDDWIIRGCREISGVGKVIEANTSKARALITGNLFPVSGGIDMGQSEAWTIEGNILSGAVLFDENGGSTGEDINIIGNYWYSADAYSNAVIEGSAVTDGLRINIRGNYIETGDAAIWITDALDVSIEDNTISGAYGSIRLTNVIGGTIAGNHITGDTDDTDAAIYLSGCAELNVSGNTISDGQAHAIQLAASNDCLIEANLIIRPGRDADNTWDGILLAGDSDLNDIWGNKIIGDSGAIQPRYGINISAAACDDNSYLGNRTGPGTDYGTGAYNDAGTGTINTWPGAAAPQGDNLL